MADARGAGGIEVSQPAHVPPAGEGVLPGLGSAVTLPPRYVQTVDSEPTFAQFSHVAFAGGTPGSDEVQGGVQAFAHAEFQPGAQGVPRQSTLVCLTDAGDVVKVVLLRSSACIPREELLADVETVTLSPGSGASPVPRPGLVGRRSQP